MLVRLYVVSILAAALLMLAALPLHAQNSTLTGVVTARETGQPLGNVSVFLEGTGYGTITQPNGRYTISNVTPGSYNVVAQTLGYADARSPNVVLRGGATVTVDFTLQMQVLSLQEVVVTGVADPTEGVRVPFTVARVSREQLPVPTTNMLQSLQGQVAGARVVSGSGKPGSGVAIRLRNRLSVNTGGSPLIVVDGVVQATATNAPYDPDFWGFRETQVADIMDLDPNDIETIEVVKGAAAASLYGSRAQNGVIQITTRRGREVGMNTTRFSVRSEVGVSMVARTTQVAQHHPYLQNDAGQWVDAGGNVVSRGNRVIQPSRMVDQPFLVPTYDNLRDIVSPGRFENIVVNMARNSESTNFFLSAGHLYEPGVLTEFSDGHLRRNFRLNLEHRFRDNLTLGVSSYYAHSDTDNLTGWVTGSNWDPFALAPIFPADITMRVRNENGHYKVLPDSTILAQNPLYTLEMLDSRIYRSRTQGSATVRYQPTSWLNLEGIVALDRSDRETEMYYPKPFETHRPAAVNNGEYTRGHSFDQALNTSLQAALIRTAGDLTSRLRLRYNLERDDYASHAASARDYRVPGLRSLNNGIESIVSGSQQVVRSESGLAALGLDYGGRYIVDALVRTDGSSLFGPDNRWNTYYRAAFAWRMAEEDWWPFRDLLTEFKPRISRGTAGSRPEFSWRYETWRVGETGPTKGQLGNTALRPELATETEIGLDFIAKDRFSVQLTYADTEVEDQLIPIPLPGVFGYSSRYQNAGTVRGKAYEATFEALLASRPDFTWRSGLVFDRSRSTLHDWPRSCYITSLFYRCEGEDFGHMYGRAFMTKPGELSQHWGGRFAPYADQFQVNDEGYLVAVGNGSWRDGLWGTTVSIDGIALPWGHPIILREESGSISLVQIGDANPRFNVGWTNNIRWRGFQVFTLWDAKVGGDGYDYTRQYLYQDLISPDMVQDGKPEETKKPLDYYGTLHQAGALASPFVASTSYLKLRQVSAGYRFTKSQLERIMGGFAMSALSLELIGRNLLTFHNYTGTDPEVGSSSAGGPTENPYDYFSYPNLRAFTFGVSIEF